MATNKKKRSAREKRILIASLVIAATIVAGSTFAWFSSKDEVTNRLSATANYGVTIAEDFQPPEDWVPGQTVNKDVSAVNTGNVDAFVRMWLEGEMTVFNRVGLSEATAVVSNNNAGANYLLSETDGKYSNLGYNFYDGNGNYYRELSTAKRENPSNNAAASGSEESNNPAQFSEVQSVQAGGYLVYAPDGAGYLWTLEQGTTMMVNGVTSTDLAKDTVVGTGNSTAGTKISAADTNYYGPVDTSTFKPETEGLYIFRRNVAVGDEVTYEYSGYYFVPEASSISVLGLDTGRDVYLALYNGVADVNESNNSENTLPANAVTVTNDVVTPVAGAIKLDTAKETVVDNTGLTWAYTAASGNDPAKLTATYDNGDNDIVIDVNLANIGTEGQTWKVLNAQDKTTTFYYNDDVEAGDSTAKLVDSLKLSDDTTQDAYIAFDFDLNVFLESIQVTTNEDGQETTEPVTAKWEVADDSNIIAAGTATTATADELSDISWS